MKAGKYSLKELFVNRYVDYIIIPEIQRDYVWKKEHIIGLLSSIILDFKKFKTAQTPIKIVNNIELENAFKDFYIKRNYNSNVGFIYAYNDEQYQNKYFLIDGQQRLTSLYLICLSLSSRNKTLIESFRKTFILKDKPKLDYRIREASRDFFKNFIDFSLKNNGDIDIKNQNWHYEDYYSDSTINNIIENYEAIRNYLDKEKVNEIDLYSYIENYVEFWYFDTNVSEQGEELYIYMNARGEQMQNNENIKADLLGRLSTATEKNEYGKKWEEWQDFFWTKKDKNENADTGFNEFLSCISGLEKYLKDDRISFYTSEDYEYNKGIQVNHVLKNLDLNIIEEYFNCLKYLEENKRNFGSNYNYSKWIDLCIKEIWEIFNKKNNTNWYADYTDPNKGTEQNRMVFIWSILYYFKLRNEKKLISKIEFFRLLRIYYLRYNNYDRSVTSISSNIQSFSDYGPWKANVGPEEILKHNLYLHLKLNEINDVEELIWELEDHKLNLDGSNVGNINISHLVDFNSTLTITNLKNIKNKFYEIFPVREKNYIDIQSLLLHYDVAWYIVTPNYYSNYKFDDWKRTIRGVDDNGNKRRKAFTKFFNDFINYNGSLVDFIDSKNSKKIDYKDCDNMRLKLLFYSQHIGNRMWYEGNYIVKSNGNLCSLPNWTAKDSFFTNDFIFYNTKGNLNGGTPTSLFRLLPNKIKITKP